MLDFLLPAAATAAAALVVLAGAGHLTHPGALRAALDRQDLVPRRLRRPLAVGLGALELAVGLAAAVALVSDDGTKAAGLSLAVLGAGFSGFLLTLLRFRPGAPCGCDGAPDAGVGPIDLLRAGAVLIGGLALAAGAAARLHDLSGPDTLATLLAGVALAAAIDVTTRAHRPLAALPS